MKIPAVVLPLLFLAVYLIAQWLISMLGWALILALILWGIAGLGLARKLGRLAALPGLAAGLLDRLISPGPLKGPAPAPSGGGAVQTPRPSSTPPAPAQPRPDPRAIGRSGMQRFEALRGLSRAKERLDQLFDIALRAKEKGQPAFGVLAPATMIIFYGAPGTGKTMAAGALAEVLYGAGITRQPHFAVLRSSDMTDQSASGAHTLGQKAAEGVLDGVLLIENVEWMAGQERSDGRFSIEVARGLMETITRHPHRIIIIATGGPELRSKLLENRLLHRELLSKINVEEVEFEDLGTAELVQVFSDYARQRDVRVERSLEGRLADMIDALRRQQGDHFDNALAIRRWFDAVYKRAQHRVAGTGGTGIELTADDFRLEVT